MNQYLHSHQGYRIQKTLREPIALEGVGVHSGVVSQIRLLPAPPNHGIVFQKMDHPQALKIKAHYESVVSTSMATTLGIPGVPESHIATVEHILSALYAMGITNCLVEVTGREIPILDGSAAPFVKEILEVGIEPQHYSTATLRVLKPIRVYKDGTVCELLPRNRLRLTTSVDFPHPSIGLQTYALDLTPAAFSDQIGAARTFGFLKDLHSLQKKNLALGASLDNVLAFSDEGALNPEGMRFFDECVRHKLLDALGDLALCGCWIEGELVSFRGGHSIHLELMKAFKDQRSHWQILPPEALLPQMVSVITA